MKTMDPEDKQRLRKNQVEFVKELEPTDVLDHLQADGILTENDCEVISNGRSRKERCQLLLSLLPTRGPAAYGSFRNALKDCSYGHLSVLLPDLNTRELNTNLNIPVRDNKTFVKKSRNISICAKCKPYLPVCCRNAELKRIFTKHCCLLMQNVEPNDIIDYHYQEHIISDDEYDRIRSGQTRRDRLVAFLLEISKCPDNKVIPVLQKSLEKKYGFIVTAIKNDLRTKTSTYCSSLILSTNSGSETELKKGGLNNNSPLVGCHNKVINCNGQQAKDTRFMGSFDYPTLNLDSFENDQESHLISPNETPIDVSETTPLKPWATDENSKTFSNVTGIPKDYQHNIDNNNYNDPYLNKPNVTLLFWNKEDNLSESFTRQCPTGASSAESCIQFSDLNISSISPSNRLDPHDIDNSLTEVKLNARCIEDYTEVDACSSQRDVDWIIDEPKTVQTVKPASDFYIKRSKEECRERTTNDAHFHKKRNPKSSQRQDKKPINEESATKCHADEVISSQWQPTKVKDSMSDIPTYHVGSVKPFGPPNKKLEVAFNFLSTLINTGQFDKFEIISSNIKLKYQSNPDMMCILGYLQASRDLFRTEFDSAKHNINSAFELVPKTSNPKYFTIELFTAKTRMYVTQKKLDKLERTLDDAKMIIETDPAGCTGRAAGWLYMNDARNKTAHISTLNCTAPNFSNTYHYLHKQALQSFQKALINFQQDGGSDGPFGFGYALCRLAILLLQCGDNGLTMDVLIPPKEDIVLAGKYLQHLEDSDIAIPKILDLHFLLAKCDYQFRRGNIVRSLEHAQSAYDVASQLNLNEFTEHAHNRLVFLETKNPIKICEIREEEATKILFEDESDRDLFSDKSLVEQDNT